LFSEADFAGEGRGEEDVGAQMQHLYKKMRMCYFSKTNHDSFSGLHEVRTVLKGPYSHIL